MSTQNNSDNHNDSNGDNNSDGDYSNSNRSSLLSSVSSLEIHLDMERSMSPKGATSGINSNNETKLENEDEAAGIMSTKMEQSGSLNITDLLMERVALTESITWLQRHVPSCVIQELGQEVLRIHRQKEPLIRVPHAKIYTAALLFVDMSGFTKLSLMLDLESLSKVCVYVFICLLLKNCGTNTVFFNCNGE